MFISPQEILGSWHFSQLLRTFLLVKAKNCHYIITDSSCPPINKYSGAVIYPHLELCCLTDIHKIMRAVPVKTAHTSEAALILPGFLITEKFATRVRGQNSASSSVKLRDCFFNLVKLSVTTCGRIFL